MVQIKIELDIEQGQNVCLGARKDCRFLTAETNKPTICSIFGKSPELGSDYQINRLPECLAAEVNHAL